MAQAMGLLANCLVLVGNADSLLLFLYLALVAVLSSRGKSTGKPCSSSSVQSANTVQPFHCLFVPEQLVRYAWICFLWVLEIRISKCPHIPQGWGVGVYTDSRTMKSHGSSVNARPIHCATFTLCQAYTLAVLSIIRWKGVLLGYTNLINWLLQILCSELKLSRNSNRLLYVSSSDCTLSLTAVLGSTFKLLHASQTRLGMRLMLLPFWAHFQPYRSAQGNSHKSQCGCLSESPLAWASLEV